MPAFKMFHVSVDRVNMSLRVRCLDKLLERDDYVAILAAPKEDIIIKASNEFNAATKANKIFNKLWST